ncbi:MAG TPA: hypothetical protein VNZ52_05055 [Candidatus Thermoplasmatota archaeon]|nr:hypothetical protein [Candidatus Thermoplasmatota archaeon]
MTETPSSETGYSYQQAVKDLDALSSFEAGLRQRTEGICWALWGLTTVGIFLTYGFVGHAWGGSLPWWATQLWVPWIAAASLLTAALWRSAALSAPQPIREGEDRWWMHVLVWAGFTALLTTAAFYLPGGIRVPVRALFILGSLGVFLGLTNILRYTPVGRKVALWGGATMAASAATFALLDVGYPIVTALCALAGGLPWFVGGLLETVKG